MAIDSKDSLKNDSTYVKAYYRRGQAHFALGQFDLAVQDFKIVCKLEPQNKDARQKYDTTLKQHKLRELVKCLSYDAAKVVVNVEDMVVEASYNGPKLENGIQELNREWVIEMLDYIKQQKVLHKKYATMIINKASELFEKENSLQHISVPEDVDITVCGDVHG